ncbi:MAG: baseplate J/gp47 family protein [Methanophagales archaeon]|nr:baseplate J/gp47 family protein [Methanophagales archaeon]
MTFGVTSSGFKLKTFDDIIKEKKAYAVQYFGTDVDLNPHSTLMKFMEVIAFEEALLWEALEAAYYNTYIDFAESASLNSIAAVMGIYRNPAVSATGVITVTGTPGTTIPEGWIVESAGGIQFQTTEEKVIEAGGTVDIDIVAVVAGTSGNLAADSITVIPSAITGVTSVNNDSATTGGIDLESDVSLRYRCKTALSVAGKGTVASIVAAVNAVAGVESVSYDENLNLHTLSLVVAGNFDSNEVDKAIEETRPAGIKVTWVSPTIIDIYVDCTITLTEDAPLDTLDNVAAEIDSYINNLGAGEDVLYFGIVDVVMDTAGVADIADLQVSKNPPPVIGESNITITAAQIAATDTTKISVGSS